VPITNFESIIQSIGQPTSGGASGAPEGEPEQKRDEEENPISDAQEDPMDQDFHKAESE